MIFMIAGLILLGLAFLTPEPVGWWMAMAALISFILGLLVVGEVLPWFRPKDRK